MLRKVNQYSPKIALMTTVGVNVGDEFIREGILSFFDEIFSSYKPFYVNKHDMKSLHEPRLDEEEILTDKFRESDIIVQAGAPVYWNWPWRGNMCYNAEWADELWYKRIFLLRDQKLVLNIGAGACQPYRDSSKTVSGDEKCADFIRKVSHACSWISVRDPLASNILMDLNLDHQILPCPAFHAARRFKDSRPVYGDVIGLNLMPFSGHFSLSEDITEENSLSFHKELVELLRKNHKLIFIAHDEKEYHYMREFKLINEIVFYSSNYKDYFPVYSQCRGIFANRVHGAVCAAGFGRPSVIVGNDSRLRIAEYIGIPSKYIADTTVHEVVDILESLLFVENIEKDRLLSIREESARKYIKEISKTVGVSISKTLIS